MYKANYECWNQLVCFVSSVYSATNKFKAGIPFLLGGKIRKTAISLSASANNLQGIQNLSENRDKIYPVLASVNVLDTYLQIANKKKLFKEFAVLDEKFKEVKIKMNYLLEETDEK